MDLYLGFIQENGYQLLFLSARAIVQAYLTRSFLLNLKQVTISFYFFPFWWLLWGNKPQQKHMEEIALLYESGVFLGGFV